MPRRNIYIWLLVKESDPEMRAQCTRYGDMVCASNNEMK